MPRKPSFDRDELIERARDIFWQRGWAGTSLKDLEKTLDLRPGSFYAAFGSKDALYELAMNKYANDGVIRLKELADTHGPLEALKAHPKRVIQNTENAAKACMLAKTFVELQIHQHPLAAHAKKHLAKMQSLITDLFTQAQNAGEIGSHHDPAHLGRRYQSDLLGLRLSAERDDINAAAIADDISSGLGRL